MLVDKVKGIIFDLDNTLVETDTKYVERIVNSTLQDYRKKASEEECCLFWYGVYREEKIRNMWNVDPDEFWRSFRKYDSVEERIANTKIYDDVIALKNLDEQLKKGILTSSVRDIALAEKRLIEPYLYSDCFVIANIFENLREKPKPDGVYKCLELLKIKPEEAILVGDSASDVLAAQAANVLDVLVERNKIPRECKPSIIIENLYGLFDFKNAA